MKPEELTACMREFSDGYDNSRFPAGFLAAYEPMECFHASDWNETLLVQDRKASTFAVAKCYAADRAGVSGEGELLKKLSHPALPSFIAEYRNETMVCVVREYVKGETLAEAVSAAPLSPPDAVGIGLQLCDALIYLHAQTPPIIHRDIKPENIILKENGPIALIDFGISRTFDKYAKTDTQKLGTRSFAPPEQYGFSQTDCRSDIFSLGMVLGFLLTQSTEFVRVRSGIRGRGLRHIVQKCTAFAPKERYASAAQVKRALRGQLPKAKVARRLIVAAVCLLLGGAAVAGILAGRAAAKSDLNDPGHVPAYITDEAIAEQAAAYLNEKYATALFSSDTQTATIGYIRELLVNVYGYGYDYANARPAAMPPMEVEESFLPWNFEDSESMRLDMMVYFAVKIYFPDVVADWSSLKGDTGEYPGIRVAKPFAEKKGVYNNVNRPDHITLGDVAVILYNADRAYGNGLPPQLAGVYPPRAKPISALGFTEPLMEQAVRAALGKSESDEVTKAELESVEAVYVFAGVISANSEDFYASADDWYAGKKIRGEITSLEDVKLLPNLRTICLAAQQISDISPLSGLPLLEKVEFKHNRIPDVSALSGLTALASVGINDNPVADLSPLARCRALRCLDLCDVPGYDPAALDRMGNFEFLDIANKTDSYAHLGARRIRVLKIGYSSIDSLSYLSDVTGLISLEVKHSNLTSLSGIEVHTELTYLNIAGCAIGDLSPLAKLPALQTLVLSEDMRPALKTVEPAGFTVSYE